jgi:hypothetical protein
VKAEARSGGSVLFCFKIDHGASSGVGTLFVLHGHSIDVIIVALMRLGR